MRVTVNLGNVPALLTRLEQVNGLKTGLALAALDLAGQFRNAYPPSRRGPAIWSDDPEKRRRQIRGFFAKLKAGAIKVPYIRSFDRNSKRMGGSWTTRAMRGGLVQVVGTAVDYAPLVVGEKQTRYHKLTGWKQVEEIVTARAGRLVQIISRSIERTL